MPKIKLAPTHEEFDINKLREAHPNKDGMVEAMMDSAKELGEVLVEHGLLKGGNPINSATKHLLNGETILQLVAAGVREGHTTKPGLGGLLKPRLDREAFEIVCIWVMFQHLFFGVRYDYKEISMLSFDSREDVSDLGAALDQLGDYDLYRDSEGNDIKMDSLIGILLHTLGDEAVGRAAEMAGSKAARKVKDNTPYGMYDDFASNVDLSMFKTGKRDLRSTRVAINLSIALEAHVERVLEFLNSKEHEKTQV